MPNKWLLLRIGVWVVVLFMVVRVMQTPQVHNELALPALTPSGSDPTQVLTALKAVSDAGCGGSGTLHVQIGATGLMKAWVMPGLADTTCLETAVQGQAWPALTTPLEMEWPLGR